MSDKSSKSKFGIALRGVAMGAADVIPGVSGGTIAFITGIYEELLETISGINFGLIKTWRTEGFKAMWKKGNFNFLLALFSGIILSIALLSVLIEHLLKDYPIPLWSFFFGLIVASIWLVGKTVKSWNYKNIIGLIVGSVIAYYITIMAPVADSQNLFYIFICGAIAVCAMILPGISGSFILLLLGAYTAVLGAISGLIKALKAGDITTILENGTLIAIFAAGCLIGLISFSKLLNWLFKKSHDLTIAILTGFLVGSLNKIWPWKETLTSFTKHAGEPNEEIVPVLQKNISPIHFTELTGNENYLLIGVLLAICGLSFIIILERFGNKNKVV
ncbi:DUF368 domain-containing protein [Crocinitomix algicola]|uniref:DUF368 domain-containing protein n=1 Tax=Crocinitomix algicola TaxID=1740263 RepID=UPI0008350118|nr:DUF368 domain-containing protein [Crocinitomix algicola]